MARRFYLPSSGSPGLGSLAYGTGWNKTSQAARFAGARTPSGTTAVARSGTSSATSPEFHCLAQFQYPSLTAQTIIGTLKGQIRGSVNNAAFNGTVAIACRVTSSTGTLRGYLLGPTPAAPVAPTSVLTLTNTNRTFKTSVPESIIPLTDVTTQVNDVLVVEVGVRDADTGTSRSGTLVFSDGSGSDLPQDETNTTGANPWVEFSFDIVFTDDIPSEVVGTLSQTLGDVVLTSAGTVLYAYDPPVAHKGQIYLSDVLSDGVSATTVALSENSSQTGGV